MRRLLFDLLGKRANFRTFALELAEDHLRHPLLAHCASQLTPYKQPRRIGLASQLPRTSVGKLARNQLQPVDADAASALTPP